MAANMLPAGGDVNTAPETAADNSPWPTKPGKVRGLSKSHENALGMLFESPAANGSWPPPPPAITATLPFGARTCAPKQRVLGY